MEGHYAAQPGRCCSGMVRLMYYFRKKGIQPMNPWTEETDMDGVSVSDADKENGSPQEGDWIAVNPKSLDDRWLVAEAYHNEHYEEAR